MVTGRSLLALSVLAAAAAGASAFDCVKKKCGDMHSCAEAYHHFSVCGETVRDRDGDGVPCENVCGKTLDDMRRRLLERPNGEPQPIPPPS